ncbi:MAG: quinoprotein dehydrogenase-associated SoxYZ-like carrier [Paracoccus sp. (in: a-proteobacteria)]|nr:quinoprotein dehydrogenase-associated SoxYZ-like carrier [Paracoccus sp. (in: a-proteobacteria)]
MKAILAGLACLLLAHPLLADEGVRNPLQPSPSWEALRYDVILSDDDPAPADGIFDIDAPLRAANPAIVPLHITQSPDAPAIEKLVIVIDENPAPVAASFTFGAAMQPLDFEIRVRVDAYSNIRAIATLAGGRQVMAGRFVRASGGCAAPAGSGADWLERAGQMRLREAGGEDGRQVSSLMIRHPNFSGLQRDQVTLLHIPARFIDRLEVTQDGQPLFTMEAGISLSEDPVFRFAHAPGEVIEVRAGDTGGANWEERFDANQTR